MSALTTKRKFSSGEYIVTYLMSSGTAKIQKTTADFADNDIIDSVATVADEFVLTIEDCELAAVTTGDATVFIRSAFNNNHIRNV